MMRCIYEVLIVEELDCDEVRTYRVECESEDEAWDGAERSLKPGEIIATITFVEGE
jgi:hypothetical protein